MNCFNNVSFYVLISIRIAQVRKNGIFSVFRTRTNPYYEIRVKNLESNEDWALKVVFHIESLIVYSPFTLHQCASENYLRSFDRMI